MKTLEAEAKKLKAQGVKIIIALTHCGINIDRIIAAKSSYVDIIVGAHSHTFLYTGAILTVPRNSLRNFKIECLKFTF